MSAPLSRLGVVALARPTFDVPYAEEVAAKAFANLDRLGLELLGPRALQLDADAVKRAIAMLGTERLDALLILQVTFTDAAMTVALAEACAAKPVLWAFPEPRTGGRLRLNSLCGINLAGHALGLARRDFAYVHMAPDAPDLAARLQAALERTPWTPPATAPEATAEAEPVVRRLRGAALGLVGRHPDGFDTCRFDPERLESLLGVRIEGIALEKWFARAQSLGEADIEGARAHIARELDGLGRVDAEATARSLRLYEALRRIAAERDLRGLAVRCWPETFTEYGCAACGPMAMLTEDGVPCACEADVMGDLTTLMLQEAAGAPAWIADLVDIDGDSDTGVVWHCGLAPLSMADPDVRPVADIHSNRRLPLLYAFPLRPGRVTLARLSRARGELKLVLAGAEMVRAPMSFSGTSGVIRFELGAPAFLDAVMGLGLEHHLSLAYGELRPVLRAIAGHLGIPVVEIARTP